MQPKPYHSADSPICPMSVSWSIFLDNITISAEIKIIMLIISGIIEEIIEIISSSVMLSRVIIMMYIKKNVTESPIPSHNGFGGM
jgi:hypothetical protein